MMNRDQNISEKEAVYHQGASQKEQRPRGASHLLLVLKGLHRIASIIGYDSKSELYLKLKMKWEPLLPEDYLLLSIVANYTKMEQG
jgi:hypothetical protein